MYPQTDRQDCLLAKVRMLVGTPVFNVQINKIAMNTHYYHLTTANKYILLNTIWQQFKQS